MDPTDDWFPCSVCVTHQGQYTLQDYIDRNGRLTISAAKPILSDIVAALGACHDRKIAYCNLRPMTVMYYTNDDTTPIILHPGQEHAQTRGVWKLVNFDSCAQFGSYLKPQMIGFISPEIARARVAVKLVKSTQAIDLFGLGRMLQWLLFANEDAFYPDLDAFAKACNYRDDVYGAKRMLKLNYLASSDGRLIKLEDLYDVDTRQVISGLLKRDPIARMPLSVVDRWLKTETLDAFTLSHTSISTLTLASHYDARCVAWG
jgi:serine/threonine protein kinase